MNEYLEQSRHPTYGILMAIPLLVLYELLAMIMNLGREHHIRNAADVWLRALLGTLDIRSTLATSALLVTVGLLVIWRMQRTDPVSIRQSVFGWMLAESVAWALLFGAIVGGLTAAVLQAVPFVSALSSTGGTPLTVPAQVVLGRGEQLVLSLGAGLYEELVFRVILVPLLASLLLATGKVGRYTAWGTAAVGSAALFSMAHHVGPYGEPWAIAPLLFRGIAGVAFSLILVLRGFGVVTWTHALYNVFLTMRL